MSWTLLVPAALLPSAIAARLAPALQLPAMERYLAEAQRQPVTPAHLPELPAHWSWLTTAFGLSTPVTAPYLWRWLDPLPYAPPSPGARPESSQWLALCEPVHLALAHDHVRLLDLADSTLSEAAATQLLALANAALSEGPLPTGHAQAPTLVQRGGRWFLRADAALDVHGAPMDAVLGQALQAHLPQGRDAGWWRGRLNEVQMRWHASAVNSARERAGERVVNGLWLHGGGMWQALPAARYAAAATALGEAPLTCSSAKLPAAALATAQIVAAWLEAARVTAAAAAAPGGASAAMKLAVYAELQRPYAYQDWDAWARAVHGLEPRLVTLLAAARAAGVGQFQLMLCGRASVQAYTLDLQGPRWRRWWRRRSVAPQGPWLAEAPPMSAAGSGAALPSPPGTDAAVGGFGAHA